MSDWTKPSRPYSIAHRGASAYAPDCSLEAYNKAVLLGADMWEVDIRLSSDGKLFAFHDGSFPDGKVFNSLTAQEIITEATRQNVPAEPLENILELAVQTESGIYADIKDVNATLPVMAALIDGGIEKAVLGAFDPHAAQLLVDADCPYPRSALVPVGVDPFEHAKGADVIHLCWEHMERPQALLDNAFFAEVERRHQLVVLWHEEDPARMAELRNLPVLGICSDRPELVHPWEAPSDWPVEVVCHRGACEVAPENTLDAAHCAFASGFHYVELDVYSLTDGTLAVIHDVTLNRTTNGHGAVSWQDSSALALLDAGGWYSDHFKGLKVPTLEEMLQIAQQYQKSLYIELKIVDPEALLICVKALGMLDKCFFWSFDRIVIDRLRALEPAANIMVRRQDVPSIDAALAMRPEVIEFTPREDSSEYDVCRAAGVKCMVAYMGSDTSVFTAIRNKRPDMVNLHHATAFRHWLDTV